MRQFRRSEMSLPDDSGTTGHTLTDSDFDRIFLAVGRLLSRVARDVALPAFYDMSGIQISEKTPGELVTCADRECERRLYAGLEAIGLGGRIIGEEAASEQPALVENLDKGLVWIIDPIDGTRNFAKGVGPFGIIVALAVDGVVQAGWLYDPLAERLCYARHGGGAYVNGLPLRSKAPMRRPVAALALQFMPEESRARANAYACEQFDLVPIPYCAAEHYPRLALGENDVALFQRTLPWDHAAGALFLTEAGGRVSRWDGSPYRFHDAKRGIIATSHASLHQRALDVLIGTGTGLDGDCSVDFGAARLF